MQKISIIGAGRVGKTLALLWSKHQSILIDGIVNKNYNSGANSVHYLNVGNAFKRIEDLPLSDVYMISCNDDAISAAAQKLADRLENENIRPVCFHVSGSLTSNVLEPLKKIGAYIASVHPLRSFADPALSQKNFAGTFCSIEGDKRAVDTLTPLFESIGARIIPINQQDKALYHTALSMTCNHLTGLIKIVQQILQHTNIPADQYNEILQHMIAHTLENVWTLGPDKALTGPIVRGDVQTVQNHLNILQTLPEHWQKVYISLGKELAKMSQLRGDASPQSLVQIEQILQHGIVSAE